jgi:undecaprenyl diphosphate synthase
MVEKSKASNLNRSGLPQHLAIIMDGNGRWATKRGFPRTAGHKAGVDRAKEIVQECADLGIKMLTLYTFSTENWARAKDEVDFLMGLPIDFWAAEKEILMRRNIRLHFIGDVAGLPPRTRAVADESEQKTSRNTGLDVNLAINYGGRQEILQAARSLCREAKAGRLDPETLTVDQFAGALYLPGPDPDFLIRTGDEKRISNFLLWQMAYTEMYFTATMWPDFTVLKLHEALADYGKRERRFGRTR